MRDRFFIGISLLIITLGMVTAAFPEGAASILIVLVFTGIALIAFRRYSTEPDFLTNIFLGALMVRLAFGVFIHVFELREFFGQDATLYDANGWRLVEYWAGQIGRASCR